MAGRRRARKSRDPSGAWVRRGTSWRFYLDDTIQWDGRRWRWRGQYVRAGTAGAQILLAILDTLPAPEWRRWPGEVETSGRRWIAGASDVSEGWDDALSRWEGAIDDGDQGEQAEDPEADMRDLRRWNADAERAPWLRWIEESGFAVFLVAGFGVAASVDTDGGKFVGTDYRAFGLGFKAYPVRGDGSIAAAQRTLAIWQRREEIDVWGAFCFLVIE